MAYSAYIKDGGTIVPFPGTGSGGSVSVNTLTSESRPSVITAGTAFDVPSYTVGSNELLVWVNGLILSKGEHYTETSSGVIAFTFDLPADASVVATATSSSGATAFVTSVQTSASRASDIASGSSYSVPSYSLGASMCEVYLDGLRAAVGSAFSELSETAIQFLTTIPADVEITVVCRKFS